MDIFYLSKNIISDFLEYNRKANSFETHIDSAMQWLCLAQDAESDGGVSLRYSLVRGWDKSYPETTGYIIPTFFDYADFAGKDEFYNRALKMADWELAIQQEDGSFLGGAIDSSYNSFVFDTGQIIFGLLCAHRITGKEKYLAGAIKAGKWLVKVQDPSGAWKSFTFHNTSHTYYTRVAWALAKLGNYIDERPFCKAASRNIDWALRNQNKNGWFNYAGFTEIAHAAPYTHTIAYAIRGTLETGIILDNKSYIESATKSADALLAILRSDGTYPGILNSNWESYARYSCLTGNAQIAIILLIVYRLKKSRKYLDAAKNILLFLCRKQMLDGPSSTRGAIAGSFPLWGQYQRFAYPNWATKFFVDAMLLYIHIKKREAQ